MTTGLDYNTNNIDCTDPSCLNCLNEPGSEWYYHNAPYTLLTSVLENATGNTANVYIWNKLRNSIGLNAAYIQVDYNRVVFSTPRSFARFGLLNLAKGNWDGTQILNEAYHHAMTTPSQQINKAYGRLWWLNGQEDFRVPGTTFTIDGQMTDNLPPDAYMALGKNSQICVVIPSEQTVIIRMGDNPNNDPIGRLYLDNLMGEYQKLKLTTSTTPEEIAGPKVYPTILRAGKTIHISDISQQAKMSLINSRGRQIATLNSNDPIIPDNTQRGIYFIRIFDRGRMSAKRIIVY